MKYNRFNNIDFSDYFIWTICYSWLIIDSVNGYFWNLGVSLPISQGIKSLLLIVLSYKFLHNKNFLFNFLLFLFLLAILFISSGIYYYPFLGTLQHLSKLLLTICLFIYFRNCILTWKNDSFEYKAFLVFKIGIIVLYANIFLGLLGIGFNTYSYGEFGYKGFFASGNELGGLAVVLVPVLLYWAYFSLSRFYYLIVTFLSIAFGFVLGTKAVIIIVIFFSCFIPYIYNENKNKLFYLLLGISFALLLIVNSIFYLIDSYEIPPSLLYKFDKGGLMLILLSARDQFVMEQWNVFSSSPIFQRLFGIGAEVGNVDTVEMDFCDILFYYGFIGLLIILVSLISLFRLIKENLRNNELVRVIKMSDIIMLLMAALAGHILFSSTAGLYIALFNSLIFSNKTYPLIYNKLIKK